MEGGGGQGGPRYGGVWLELGILAQDAVSTPLCRPPLPALLASPQPLQRLHGPRARCWSLWVSCMSYQEFFSLMV